MGSGAVGKNLKAGEEVFEGLRGRLRLTFGPEFGQAGGGEFDAFGVERFVQAVGGEQDGVAGGKLDDVLVVAGGGEKAGGESTVAEKLAGGGGGMEGKGQAGVGEGQSAGRGIEDGVERGAEPARQRTLQKALVQQGKDGAGVGAGFVNAAQRAHDQGAVHGGGKSLADDIAEEESDESVGEEEEIEEVSTDVEEGREAEVDFDGVVMERRGGDEGRLDEAGLAYVFVTDSAAGWRFLEWG